MTGNHIDDLYNKKGYRIRCMRGLVDQIKEDYTCFKTLFERLERGEGDIPLIEELVRVLSWLKQGLNTFKEMRKDQIEGVLWGDINRIDRDMKEKEMHLKLFLYSVSMESESAHSSNPFFRY
jgi:hypothetical protein